MFVRESLPRVRWERKFCARISLPRNGSQSVRRTEFVTLSEVDFELLICALFCLLNVDGLTDSLVWRKAVAVLVVFHCHA